MCFCVTARALSTTFPCFPAPLVSSLFLFLISACRRSKDGRTWPFSAFAVSVCELEIPYYQHQPSVTPLRRLQLLPGCWSGCCRTCPRFHQGSGRSGALPSGGTIRSAILIVNMRLCHSEVVAGCAHLQNLLILLRLAELQLLGRRDVLLDISARMLPRLETLLEELRHLWWKSKMSAGCNFTLKDTF